MTTTIRADAAAATRPVSPTLYGLFYEDINYSCDGGLNANLVNNFSFDAVSMRSLDPEPPSTLPRVVREPDRLRHWRITGGSLTSSGDDAPAVDTWFGRIRSDGGATLANDGYPGDRPSMAFSHQRPLRLEALLRAVDFDGAIEVTLESEAGEPLASAEFYLRRPGWQRVEATLSPASSATGSLAFTFLGGGTIDVDQVSLIPEDHWGAGDPRWSQGKLRRDLVEVVQGLQPSFMRFPGGCIVEGHGLDNAYDWKKTVGPIGRRGADFNLWAEFHHGDYSQSFQVGYYEYFLLCEDLEVEPLPIVSAGIACQFRCEDRLDIDSDEFDKLVQDTLDLIDWATADPDTNEWAALRAAAGHPAPFRLNYLGIGNENWGPAYLERFDRIRAAVTAHRPGITTVLSAGVFPEGEDWEAAREHARTIGDDVVVDEHFYAAPDWVIDQATRYDDAPRGGPGVFLGEYAAHPPSLAPYSPEHVPNTFRSALAEAAFLTGVERNADVVAMTSYAPLLSNTAAEQWQHNLILFTGTRVLRTTNYFVQQLFGTTVGDRIVPVEGALPGGLLASSTTSDDRQFIKFVNVAEEERSVTLAVPSAAGERASATTLTGRPEDRNTFDAEGEPVHRIVPVTTEIALRDGSIHVDVPGHAVVSIEVPRS